MNRKEIKEKAKKLLKGNVWNLFAVIIVFELFQSLIANLPEFFGIKLTTLKPITLFGTSFEYQTFTASGSVWQVLVVILAEFFTYGMTYYFIKTIRKEKVTITDSLKEILNNWEKLLLVIILVEIFTALGYICFIIPGIIITLGLSLYNYVFIDNKDLKPMEIIKKCWNMMKGHKWEYFVFELSFIGWTLLCIFIVPIVYVLPYMSLATALYYENVKKDN